MTRYGNRWSIIEVCRLYSLLKAEAHTEAEASEIMGRSINAMKAKAVKGGLFQENPVNDEIIPTKEYLSIFKFLENLRGQRQYELPDIPARFRKGKLTKIFKKNQKRFSGVWSLPVNKRHLIPLIEKWDCKQKYKSSNAWWRFSHYAQANPFMRSQLFKRENGLCALCGDQLSEADYQAHHSDYDHTCTYRRSIMIESSIGMQKIPDCESCSINSPEKFSACMKRLHAVHGICNRKISVDE